MQYYSTFLFVRKLDLFSSNYFIEFCYFKKGTADYNCFISGIYLLHNILGIFICSHNIILINNTINRNVQGNNFSLISAEVNPYTVSFKEVIKILSVIFSSLVNTCSKSFVDRSEVIITTSFFL